MEMCFNLIGITVRSLKEQGMETEAGEMRERAMRSGSYHEALAIMLEYVEPYDPDEPDRDIEDTRGPSVDYTLGL